MYPHTGTHTHQMPPHRRTLKCRVWVEIELSAREATFLYNLLHIIMFEYYAFNAHKYCMHLGQFLRVEWWRRGGWEKLGLFECVCNCVECVYWFFLILNILLGSLCWVRENFVVFCQEVGFTAKKWYHCNYINHPPPIITLMVALFNCVCFPEGYWPRGVLTLAKCGS